jgi:P-type Na+/K+ transporter
MRPSLIFPLPNPETEPTKTAPLTPEIPDHFLAKYEQLASKGLRVISLGHRFMSAEDAEVISCDDAERGFTFLALARISDPPRPETLSAVRACTAAGIVVHTLTGDHIATARAIAREVEIIGPDSPPTAVMTVRCPTSLLS